MRSTRTAVDTPGLKVPGSGTARWSALGSWVGAEKGLFFLGLVMSGIVLLAVAWPMLLGKVYVADDLGIFYLTTRFHYSESLLRGESFIWSPGMFAGYYLHGEGQVGMLHPLHLLLYRTLPLSAAFNLELLTSYLALLAGTFVFLRRWEIRRDAALFGALVFTFSGFNFLHFVHPNVVAVTAHLPWLLLFLDRVMCSNRPRRVAGAKLVVALLTTSQLLLGHPQAVWLSMAIEVLYVGFRTGAGAERSRLFAFAEAKLLGVLGGCVQLLPTWDVLKDSIRAAPNFLDSYRYLDSLHPANALQLVSPYLARTRVFGRSTQDYALYTGALASILSLWLFVRRKELGSRRPLVLGALALGSLGFVLALGKYGLLVRLQEYVPLVQWLGVPVRYVLFLHLAMGVAAAVAFADIAERAERRGPCSWREMWPLGVFPLASILTAALALVSRTRPELFPAAAEQVASAAHVLAGPLLVTLAACLVAAALRGTPHALAGIVVFAALDQGVYGTTYLHGSVPPVPLESFVKGQASPPDTNAHRVHSNNNILTLQGVRLSGGYAAFRPRRLLDELDRNRLQLAGVGWIQSSTPWASARSDRKPETAEGVRVSTHDALGRASIWSQVSNPMPRARLVSKEFVGVAPREDIPRINLETTAWVSQPLRLEEGPPGEVSIAHDAPGDVRLVASARTRQLLVLSESWHEGWKVTVNGEIRPVVRVYGDFLGCVVQRGESAVEFRFSPSSLRLGAWLSALGISLMLFSFAGSRYRNTGRGKSGAGPTLREFEGGSR